LDTYVSEETLIKVAKLFGGEEGARIMEVLKEGGEVTVEEISSRTNINVNDVRRFLYKLYNHSLVTSRRFRDPETGWFIFYWRLQPELIGGFIQSLKKKILRNLEARLEYERSHEFYHCYKVGCPIVTFEEAMELMFRCPTCGKPLRRYDNTKIIRVLEKKIKQLREELGVENPK